MRLLPLPATKRNDYGRVFLLCALTAACIFLPFVVIDAVAHGGYFQYAGDFNDQQITFYSYANAFTKQGGGFSWATDLGSGFVNSYSFYLVGSPFWWLTLLLPARLTPYFMVPMLCLKFGLAGGGAWLWMRRYTHTPGMAVVGACLYAFSGFSVYSVFFNHFVDVIALFPYLLWALDAALYDGKKGFLPLFVALNLLNNYFFFAGQILFLFIYFFCKLSAGDFRLTGRLFGQLAFECLLGCGLGCVIAWPAVLSLMQNPRTVDLSSGYGFLLYGKVQQYFAILYNLFLMPEAPYTANMWSEGITKWTNLTAYLPLCSAAGVLAWLKCRPGTAFKRILCTCLAFAFVPVLNSAFYLLNSSFYARWYYMPILVMCAVTVRGLEEQDVDVSGGITAALCICLTAAAFALVPVLDEKTESWSLGVVDYQSEFWGILLVTLLGLLIFGLLVLNARSSPRFAALLLAAVLPFSWLYAVFHIGLGKFGQWESDRNLYQQTYREAPQLRETLPEGFYRIDAYDCYNNMGLWLDRSCIQFFGSTVSPSILEFYPSVGVKRDVNSKPDQTHYALRALLSVRYLLCPTEKVEELEKENSEVWEEWTVSGSYTLYENPYCLPMGLAYDAYIPEEEWEVLPQATRENLLLRALVLTPEQAEQYGDVITPLPDAQTAAHDFAAFEQDCETRRGAACTAFAADNTGFTAAASLDRAALVLFAVPYDDGFSATVNGQSATIERVDSGLMAVLCPAGESQIAFTYHTPGLAQSGAVAGGCAVVYLVWLAVLLFRRRRTPDVPDVPDVPPDEAANQETSAEEQPWQKPQKTQGE